MNEYMPVDAAKAVIDAECGSDDFTVLAHGELWVVANLPRMPRPDASSYLDIGIERVDAPEEYGIDAAGFEDDDEAVGHVRRNSESGSPLHARALRIDHAANSLRFHIWGAEGVHRRTWPEPQTA